MSFDEINQRNWEQEMDGHIHMHTWGIREPLSLRMAKTSNELSTP